MGAMMNKPEISPAQTAIQLAFGFINARSLYVAAKLGVADHLKDGPKSAVELATTLSVQPDALYRIMRVLAASGVFAHAPQRTESLFSHLAGSGNELVIDHNREPKGKAGLKSCRTPLERAGEREPVHLAGEAR
jgi:hypothetical protein